MNVWQWAQNRKFTRAKYLPKSRGSSSRLGSLLPTQMASGNIPEASKGNDIAERMLGKILGDEEEKQEVEAPWALAGAEAFALLLAAMHRLQPPSQAACSQRRVSTIGHFPLPSI
jgi:hypothetical protein